MITYILVKVSEIFMITYILVKVSESFMITYILVKVSEISCSLHQLSYCFFPNSSQVFMEIVLFEMTKVHFPNILKSSYAMHIYVNSFFLSLDNLNMEKVFLNENMNKQIKRDTVRPLFVIRYLLKFQGVKRQTIFFCVLA